MYCKKCGNTLSEKDRFCRKCGERAWFLDVIEVPEPAEPVKPAEVLEPAEPVKTAEVPETELRIQEARKQETRAQETGANTVDKDAKDAFDFLDRMFADLGFGEETSSVGQKASQAESKNVEASFRTDTATNSNTGTTTNNSNANTTTDIASDIASATTTATDIESRILESITGQEEDDYEGDDYSDSNGTEQGVAPKTNGANGFDENKKPNGANEAGGTNSAHESKEANEAEGTNETEKTKSTADAEPTKPKRSILKTLLWLLAAIAIIAVGTVIFLNQWPKIFQEEVQNQQNQPSQGNSYDPSQGGSPNAGGAGSQGTSGNAGTSGIPTATVNPLDFVDDDKDIMQASIEVFAGNGPNIKAIETIYNLKFTEDRDYHLEGLNKAILFDDDLWYMNDLMENIHYTPEIVRTIIEFVSTWMDQKSAGTGAVLSYIKEDSELYKEMQDLKPDGKVHAIEKMQIGEMRRSGEDFYILLNLTESVDGANQQEYVKALHLFARPKVLEVREMRDPVETKSAESDNANTDNTNADTANANTDNTNADNTTNAGESTEDKDG